MGAMTMMQNMQNVQMQQAELMERLLRNVSNPHFTDGTGDGPDTPSKEQEAKMRRLAVEDPIQSVEDGTNLGLFLNVAEHV